jgi:hypothetical protein
LIDCSSRFPFLQCTAGAWRLCGFSRRGNVISNYKLQHWDPGAYSVEEYVQFVVYMLELTISKMPKQKQNNIGEQQLEKKSKFLIIFDLKGFSASWVFRRDVRMMIRKLLYIAQAQYPERLQNVLLFNAPRGFESAWRLIKPLLDEKTATKIAFVGASDKDVVDAMVDPSVLSVEYGGTHPDYPLP